MKTETMCIEEIRELRKQLLTTSEEITQALRGYYGELRTICEHPKIYTTSGLQSWGERRMCATCGICEDETLHGTGFHVLKKTKDRWFQKAETELRELAPDGQILLIDWCHGDKDHPSHWVRRKDLTKGGGTRCKDYEGYFDQ